MYKGGSKKCFKNVKKLETETADIAAAIPI